MLFILSEFTNVVNNDADNGWTTILDKFKKNIQEISDDIKEIFDLLSNEDIKNWTNNDLVDFVDGFDGADDSLKNFLKTWDGTGDIAEQYQQHLSNASSASAEFSAKLKSIAANVGIMFAINLAIKAIQTAWDAWNETVEESQAKVDKMLSFRKM